ncbi:carboxypeptidase-like regulatory domain-containing protein [Chitinophaga sp. RAB17]|uniref:carboxypeptidase-like regulatory domain-containing protein n=1 Tax=Chitinophaga sp. RAB17 TaxID=3233049 RepID=UPI003F8FEA0B
MKRSGTFSAAIPQPCQESWRDMSSSDGGKFCGSCQKKVIDFSTLTDAEIVNIFSGPSQKICGRFNPSQLDRILDKQERKGSVLSAAVLTTLLVITGLSKTTASSVKVPFIHIPFAAPAELTKAAIPPPFDTSRVIVGKIIDSQDKTSLPGVSVIIKGTTFGTATDATGNFRLQVPESLRNREVTLQFAYIGYNRKELPVRENGPLIIEIEMGPHLSGEVVVTCMRKATFRERMKRRWKWLWGQQ